MLSLVATPWLLLISTTNALFLDNQADLGYSLRFYLPFGLAFLACTFAGFLLFFLTRKIPALMPALWAFYVAGPLFLLFSMLRSASKSVAQEIMLLGVLGAAFLVVVFLLRGSDPAQAARGWIWLGLIFIAIDAFSFASRFELDTRAIGRGAQDGRRTRPSAEHPNIYHLLFDGYQSDVFPLALSAETASDLRGFQYFPKNTASSGRTRVSIPSVFAGRAWDPSVPRERFISGAMSSEESMLHWLSVAGYETTAYLHRRFSFQPNLFHQVWTHDSFYRDPVVRRRLLESDAFRALWLYRVAPRLLSRRILGERVVDKIATGRLAPKAYVTGSYATFEQFLAGEEALGSTGRYTFVHLLLPHEPFVLNESCEYQNPGDAMGQFRCANRMIGRFVRLLKRLGRFDDSMILVHGDHGLGFQLTDGRLDTVAFDERGTDWNRPRSKALLLLKAPGQGADKELVISPAETSLLDIAPTILHSLGVGSARTDGFPLLPTPQIPEPRRRYYQYHMGDRTDEVYRFVIDGDRFEFDRILRQEAPGGPALAAEEQADP